MSSESKRGGAPSTPAATHEVSPASFEDGIKRLSEIVQTLERGDLPLEESLRLFEEGVGLSRASQERLDSAQKRVEELLGFERDGRPRTKDFEVRGERDRDE
jgi:exodeoxyribonuclease VII small subunit